MRYRSLLLGVWMAWMAAESPPAEAVDYKLPWPGGRSFQCTQSNNSSFSHTGLAAYAWDFGMVVGSDIVAAADGTVVLVQENVTVTGTGSGNYVVINHTHEQYSAYLHLQFKGIEVEIGDFVRQGQLIAHSGNTGYSSGPHLHFQVQVSGERSHTQSVPIQFSDLLEDGGKPRGGKRYMSGNYLDPARPIDPTVNRFPAFVSSPVLRAVVGRAYAYNMEATDPNGDALTYGLMMFPHQSWLSLDPTSGLISGLAPIEGVTSVTMMVRVDDQRGGFDRQTYTMDVLIPPAPPIGVLATPMVEGTGVLLTWGSSPDDTEGGPIVGYRVYRGEQPELNQATLLGSTASGTIQYMDESVPTDVPVHYWVEAVDQEGIPSDPVGTASPITGIEIVAAESRPTRYALDQNVPNPFNGETTIAYRMAESGPVALTMYSPTGQRVRTLVQGDREAGDHRVRWDATDDAGRPVASGMYLCSMITGEYRAVRKLVLVR